MTLERLCVDEPPPSDEETFLDDIYDFANTDKQPPRERRAECEQCGRPVSVCWCPYLPKERINIQTTVIILQHPFEELRKLKTAPMLNLSLSQEKCLIVRGKKFGGNKRNIKYPDLNDVIRASNSVLLYPGDDAVDISELSPSTGPYNLIVLDGTWTQAKGMYANNADLRNMKKVKINCDRKSQYVIRTQPTDSCLSTLESVAVALSVLEDKPHLSDILIAPLVGMCGYQINHGAVQHQSREYKIANGLWTKRLPSKLLKQIERDNQARNDGERTGNSTDDHIEQQRDNTEEKINTNFYSTEVKGNQQIDFTEKKAIQEIMNKEDS